MNNLGGSSGGSGNIGGAQGGFGNQQGGGFNTVTTSSIATAIATPTTKATATSTSSAQPVSSSTASANNTARTIIIASVIGSVAFLLLLVLIITCCLTRSHSKKAKAKLLQQKGGSKESGLAIQPIAYGGPNQAFKSAPPRPRRPSSIDLEENNIEALSPQPLMGNEPRDNGRQSRNSIASRRSARGARAIGNGDSAVDLEGDLYHSEDFLPPTYEDSQSDAMSMRVLTPQYPLPSAFLANSGGLARTAGFLDPTLSPQPSPAFNSPYASSAVFSPSSIQAVFHANSEQDNRFAGTGQYREYTGVEGRERYNERDGEEEEPISPMSRFSLLEVPSPLVMGGQRGLDRGMQPASLENLVRGPGGLLGRSTSGRTVSSFSSVSGFSEGDLREMNQGRSVPIFQGRRI